MAALTSLTPRSVKRVIHAVLRRLGLKLVPADYTNAFELRALRQHWLARLDTSLVVDVGANMGQFAQMLRTEGYGGAIVSFEPQRAAYSVLSREMKADKNWRGVQCGLGATNADMTLQVAENSMSSSLLPMLVRHTDALADSKIVTTETVPIRRLDEVLEHELKSAKNALLKIDTQGFEAAVLKGASAIMEELALVELELSLVPLYEGQELLADMILLMDTLGFIPIAIEQGFVDPKQCCVLQVDGLFVARRYLSPS